MRQFHNGQNDGGVVELCWQYTQQHSKCHSCTDLLRSIRVVHRPNRNARDHLTWTMGKGVSMHEVYTSRMGTIRVKHEKEADTRIIVRN